MFVLMGYTRWPVFLSGDGRRNLGSSINNPKVADYIRRLGSRKGIVILTMENIQSKTRFVTDDMAVHPSFGSEEICPRNVFVYPCLEPDVSIVDAYARGVVMKGSRKPMFVPLVTMRNLDEREVDAVKAARPVPVQRSQGSVADLTLERMLEFARSVGISVNVRDRGSQKVLTVNDPETYGGSYQVLLSSSGIVNDTNVCVSVNSGTYLPEFLMLLREERDLYIYSSRW